MPSRKEGVGHRGGGGRPARRPDRWISRLGRTHRLDRRRCDGTLVDGREELIAATRKLLENPGFAGQLGDAARDAATGYSLVGHGRRFTEVFAEVNPDVAW